MNWLALLFSMFFVLFIMNLIGLFYNTPTDIYEFIWASALAIGMMIWFVYCIVAQTEDNRKEIEKLKKMMSRHKPKKEVL